MSLFGREAAPPEAPTITGIDVLRNTLKAATACLQRCAIYIPGVGLALLDGFIAGRADLNDEQLQALT
jgi:hypothetical protein